MKLSPRFKKNTGMCLFVLILSGFLMPLSADDNDIEKTLQRMELLLQQQQQELEAQRQELAEQRALIQELQQQRETPASQTVSTPEDKPEKVQLVSETESRDDIGQPPADPDVQQAQLAEAEAGSGKEQALAELSRREKEGVPAEKIETTSIAEDPSNTTYDLNFPGAWHLPGTTAAMKIAGYVNVAMINSFDPMLVSDRFIVGSIPPEGEDVPGAKSGTEVTANQTRINYEVREETTHGTLRAFIEGDFYGSGDTFRLRHAFGQYRSGLAGKTWSTLMDIESQPEAVDFEGINGMILARQAQLRIFPKYGESMSFKLGIEDPRTDVVNGQGVRGNADVVMSVDRLSLGQLGDWNSRVAVILRDLEAQQIVTGGDPNLSSDTMGWGITTSGRKSLKFWGEDDFLLWQVTYGKGVGRYLNDLNTVGGGDAVFDPQGNLRALPVFAGYVSYGHGWPKNFGILKSWPGILRSNLTFSWVNIDNFDFQEPTDYRQTLRASINLIYLPTKNLKLGAELLWGERKNKDDSAGTATQLQVSARYNF